MKPFWSEVEGVVERFMQCFDVLPMEEDLGHRQVISVHCLRKAIQDTVLTLSKTVEQDRGWVRSINGLEHMVAAFWPGKLS